MMKKLERAKSEGLVRIVELIRECTQPETTRALSGKYYELLALYKRQGYDIKGYEKLYSKPNI